MKTDSKGGDLCDVYLYYSKIEEISSNEIFLKLYEKLPQELQEKNNKYRFNRDKYAHVLGKILLKKNIEKSFRIDSLNLLKYGEYNKPYIPHIGFDFNISHSGNYVLFALTTNGGIGVDIEEKKTISYVDFLETFSESEQHIIEHSNHPLECFYDFWVRREAVIKANGKGFFSKYREMTESKGSIELEGKKYFYQEIKLDTNYKVYISSDNIFGGVHVKCISITNLVR